jgi:hypothetical protein
LHCQVQWIKEKKEKKKDIFFNTGYDVSRHFQQYFSYIVAVRFGGGEKPPTFRKSLTNFIT